MRKILVFSEDAVLKELVGDRELGTQLSFALYGAANRMARLHKPFLEPLGLTFPQYLVMLELYGGTPRSVGELGAHLAWILERSRRFSSALKPFP